jgi:glycosyltransferase involved in cell wall biosynthesis
VRILFVDLEHEWRGGQDQALLALVGFIRAGHAATLVAVEDGALAGRARAQGVEVHGVPARAKRLGATRRLRQLVRQERYDIVHANEPHALTAAWLAGAHRRAALVVSRRIALPLQRNALALARYRAAGRILAVSQFVAASLGNAGLPAHRVEVVYDGVEVLPLPTAREREEARRHWDVPQGEALLGCVGYLLPEKGQRHLVSALALLREDFPGARLLLAGGGACRVELEALAKALKVGSRVIFTGHVEDVQRVYAALDVFVLPSRAEPLGSSLLMAMGCGLPVVALESGGVPEVIVSGRDGLLVNEPRGEKIAGALAGAMREVLSTPERAAALGAAARKTIEERFSAERMVRETLRTYARIVGETTGQAAKGRDGQD